MKKTLALLTMSLLLVAAMMLGVSATIKAENVGGYIRFDSQEVIDAHTSAKDINISYDAEKGALRYDTIEPAADSAADVYADNNLWVYFAQDKDGNWVDAAQYPYVRVTYQIDTNCSSANSYLFANVNKAREPGKGLVSYNAGSLRVNNGAWNRYVADWSALDAAKYDLKVADLRLDVPNNIYKGQEYTVWIYDVGFFSSVEAAYAYSPNQTNYVLDLTDEAVIKTFFKADGSINPDKAGKSEVGYDTDLEAFYFLHAKIASGADERIRHNIINETDFFSADKYPHFSMKSYSSSAGQPFYLINSAKNNNFTAGFWDTSIQIYPNAAAETWEIFSTDLSGKGGDTTDVIVQHVWDPINVGSSDGTDLIAMKYVAYYATAEEAKLESQAAPKGLKGVMPTAADGKGKITGVNDTMEYRATGNANTYTAVPTGVTEIEVDAGKTYDVRYAAKDGFNAGYAAEVGVPAYWNFNLKGIKGVDCNVTLQDGVYNIEVPYGTNLNSVELDYTITTSNAKSFNVYRSNGVQTFQRSVALYKNAEFMAQGAVIGAFDATAYLSTPLKLHAFEELALYQPVSITFSVAESNMNEEETVDAILESITSTTVTPDVVMGAADADAAAAAIEKALRIDSIISMYPGADAGVEVVSMVPAVAGTAADKDGTDGSVVYKVYAGLGTTEKYTEAYNITVPAERFRVLFMFNDQAMADSIFVYNTGIYKLNENGKVPVVNGAMHFEINADGTHDLFYALGKEHTKADLTSGNFTALLDTADYPYIVYGYKSSKYTGNHIYFETDYYIENNNYTGPADISQAQQGDGSFVGYTWARDKGFWSAGAGLFPVATTSNVAVINGNGGTAGLSYAGNGYKNENGVDKFNVNGVNFPWKGKLSYFRSNISKNVKLEVGDYYDLEYIAFFPSMAALEAWDGSVATPFTADEKTAINSMSIADAEGASAGSENAAKAYVLSAVKTALGTEYADVRIKTVSYTGYDLAANTDGSYKFTAEVVKGDTLGDRDVYTSKEYTIAIKAPKASVANAKADLEAVSASAPAVFSASAAKVLAEKAIADVKSAYAGYTFTVNAGEYTAPTAEAAGSLKFTVTVTDASSNSETTRELTMTIAAGKKPVIYNFASPILTGNAFFSLVVSNTNKSLNMVADEASLGGAYASMTRETGTSEFNMTFNAGANGNPAVDDLGDYPVVLYRYKAPFHAKYQIYYYTDLLTGGHAYQAFVPSKDVNSWNEHIHTVNPAGNSAGASGSYAWDGKLNKIRFDFFRNYEATGVTLDINYIGLFESVEQAEAFIAAPYLDADTTVAELTTKYADGLAKVNAIETVPYATDSNIMTALQAYLDTLNLENAYVIYKSSSGAVAGTADDIDGTDGYIKFTIAFADSANNGYAVESKELTMPIAAALYTTGETTGSALRTEDNALRFFTSFAKDWMKVITDTGANIEYGTLVIPTHMLTGELTLDTENAAKVEAKYIYRQDETEITFTAAVTGIEANGAANTELTARAYAKFTYKGAEKVVYFNTVAGKLAYFLNPAE